MHSRLAELTQYLEQQRRAVLDAAAVLPDDTWRRQPAGGRWSMSQIFEHLHRVELGVAAVLAKRIGRARETGHPAETDIDSPLGTLDSFKVSDRSRRLDAPDIVIPTGNPDRATAERMLAESRHALLAAIESGDGLALGSIRHTHPRLGELDLYQWILFVGEHEKRHVPQIAEVAAELAAAS